MSLIVMRLVTAVASKLGEAPGALSLFRFCGPLAPSLLPTLQSRALDSSYMLDTVKRSSTCALQLPYSLLATTRPLATLHRKICCVSMFAAEQSY
jgi:hypothetical protein